MDEFDCAPVECGSDKVYTILKISDFFKVYKHVLEESLILSRLDENELPFKKNLIECRNKIMPLMDYLKKKMHLLILGH